MKSLLSSSPFTSSPGAPGRGNRRALTCALLGAVACLAIPVATAYAQVFTGIVSCVETHTDPDDGTLLSIENEYSVTLDGITVEGRWGEGRDVEYGGQVSFQKPDEFLDPGSIVDAREYYSNRTETFYTMDDFAFEASGESDSYCLFESFYSETGIWKYKVRKDRVHVRGTSFVVMDYSFAEQPNDEHSHMAAECTWELSGPLPSE